MQNSKVIKCIFGERVVFVIFINMFSPSNIIFAIIAHDRMFRSAEAIEMLKNLRTFQKYAIL